MPFILLIYTHYDSKEASPSGAGLQGEACPGEGGTPLVRFTGEKVLPLSLLDEMTLLMRILMFIESFLPPAYVPRLRYFMSYFLEKGWEVDCVAERSGHEQFLPQGVRLLAVPYYKCDKGLPAKVEWLLKFVLGVAFDYKGRYFFRKSRPFWEEKTYDVVFCSSNFTFPLTVSAKVAALKRIPLFVDLRDIAEQSPDDNYYMARRPPRLLARPVIALYKKTGLSRRNRVLAKAEAVTTVSPWHVKTLSAYNDNTQLVYNGFDERQFYPAAEPTPKFTISYFGRIFNELMRDPRPLLESVARLSAQGVLSPDNTVMRWFVDEVSRRLIDDLAGSYGLQAFMDYRDFVSPYELQTEMARSSVLVVLMNTPKKRFFGMMTTKFFEAVGTNRPVLCTPDNGDCLPQVVRAIRCGIASSDPQEIDAFLLRLFNEWKATGRTVGTVDEQIRMDYSRRQGAEVLEQLFIAATQRS